MSSSSSAAVVSDREVPRGSPTSIQTRQSVRKRTAAHHHTPTSSLPFGNNSNSNHNTTPSFRGGRNTTTSVINPHLIYRDYAHYYNNNNNAAGDSSKSKGSVLGRRIRSFVTTLLMISFPLSIFVLPIWWHTPTYPRVVVAVRTTQERLPLLLKSTSTRTLQAMLFEESSLSPDMVYLILPPTSDSNNKQEEDDATLLNSLLPDTTSDTMSDEVRKPNIQILRSTEHYGNTVTSSALAAVEQEQRFVAANMDNTGKEQDASESILEERDNDDDGAETRIILFHDDDLDRLIGNIGPPLFRGLLQTMVEASQAYPGAVLSGIGGNWRSHFRQIKRVATTATTTSSSQQLLQQQEQLDQFPNVLLHSAEEERGGGGVSPPVDLLDSSMGIIFRVGVLRPAITQSFQDHWNGLTEQQEGTNSVDYVVLELGAGDVVWSGLLQAHNVTRRVVQIGAGSSSTHSSSSSVTATGNSSSTTTEITTSSLSRRHWMTAAYQLQQHWKIWKGYTFWDWSTLSEQQKEAMECEGQFEPECTYDDSSANGGVVAATTSEQAVLVEGCRPNPQHCGDETPFGPILAALSNKS